MTDPGMQLFESCKPPVWAGDELAIHVSQSLAGEKQLMGMDAGTVHVAVHGPRCVLGPADVAGQYPAPGSTDSPAEFLPHVALRRRTLPWERRGPIDAHRPWLALLLVKQSELLAPDASIASAGTLASLTVAELAQHDGATHSRLVSSAVPGPPFAATDELHVAFLNRGTIAGIMPTAHEVGLLCHMKRATGDPAAPPQPNGKPLVPAPTTDTALVICNRLPTVDGDGHAEPHIALLVSLERRADLFGVGVPPLSKLTLHVPVALVVLHHWTFTPSAGGDFEQAMQEIKWRPNGGVLRFGNLPADAAPDAAPLSGEFAALLDHQGFPATPLEHAQRSDVAYRGPLRPFPPAPRSKGLAIRAAPHELEPEPGKPTRLDCSYAAAFELGRLLALHDAGILEDLRNVRMPWQKVVLPPKTSNMPAVLQMEEWVSDPAWRDHPWELGPGGAASVIKGAGALESFAGNVDPAGLQAIEAQRAGVLAQLKSLDPAVAKGSSSFDAKTIGAADLAMKFPSVKIAVQP